MRKRLLQSNTKNGPEVAADEKNGTDTKIRKFAVITGANRPSMGFQAAQILANAPFHYHVILACRDAARGSAAEKEITSGANDALATFVRLDLASMESIRRFCAQVDALVGPRGLSLLINNAGKGFVRKPTRRRYTTDGFEEILGVNYVGPFLLTTLMLPILARTPGGEARIVNVTSGLHDPTSAGNTGGSGKVPEILLPDAHVVNGEAFKSELMEKDLPPLKSKIQYCKSKLCNVMHCFELQRRIRHRGLDIAVNCVCPGFVPDTGLSRDSGALAVCMMRFCLGKILPCVCGKKITRTVEDAAMSQVLVATDFAASGGGQMFVYSRDHALLPCKSSLESRDEEKARRLYDATAEMLHLSDALNF